MMRSVNVLVLLAFAVQNHAREFGANHSLDARGKLADSLITANILLAFVPQAHAEEFTDELANELVDRAGDALVDRSLQAYHVGDANLREITLGKRGQFSISTSSNTHLGVTVPRVVNTGTSVPLLARARLRRGNRVMSSRDELNHGVSESLRPTERVTRRGTVGMAGGAVAGALLPSYPAPAKASAPARELTLPRLGLGAWSWGDTLFWGYDPKKDGDLSEVFDYAVSKGVRLFDTAEVYGFGRSETLLGQFASRNPAANDVQVATKFAAYPWRTKPSDVLDAAKASTDRLGRPIDLYQIHFPNGWANEAYWDGLGEAVSSGLVRAAGVSNYGVDALRACHAKLKSRGIPLVSNQIQLSLIYPFALENGLVDACNELGVSVLAYSPLGLGLLTGKFAFPDKLPEGPRKALVEQFLRDPNFGALLDTMRDVGASKPSGGASPSQVALAWCIAKGACVIPGARTLKQASSNIGALDVKLSLDEVRRLDAAASKVKKVLTPDTNPFAKKDIFTGMKMYDS